MNVNFAPIYDMVSTIYYLELSPTTAMKIGGEYSSEKATPKNFELLAEEAGLAKPMVKRCVTELGETILAALPELDLADPVAEVRMSVKMDGGREVQLDPVKHPPLDHGYSVTSHSSQGQTADRVLINLDTELCAKDVLINLMAYVAVSRGAYDAQFFTDSREKLGHDVSHTSAHEPEVKQDQTAKVPEQAVAPKPEIVVEQKAVFEPVDKVYSWPEVERHWVTLKNAVTAAEGSQFGWKADTGTIQPYEHFETQRGLRIDRPTGQFYGQDGSPITAKEGLDHAMPKGEANSHSQAADPAKWHDRTNRTSPRRRSMSRNRAWILAWASSKKIGN